jgi:hypothetical protein
MTQKFTFGKTAVLAAALGGMFLLGSGAVQAADRDKDREKCEQRIHKAEDNLRKQIDHHGEHSRQAESARRNLDEQRDKCRREFGDHDRDRDRDHL